MSYSYLTLSTRNNGDRGDRCAPTDKLRHDPLWATAVDHGRLLLAGLGPRDNHNPGQRPNAAIDNSICKQGARNTNMFGCLCIGLSNTRKRRVIRGSQAHTNISNYKPTTVPRALWLKQRDRGHAVKTRSVKTVSHWRKHANTSNCAPPPYTPQKRTVMCNRNFMCSCVAASGRWINTRNGSSFTGKR